MRIRNTLAVLVACVMSIGLVHDGPMLNLAASSEDNVVVVVTLTGQPAVTVGARSGDPSQTARQRDAEDAILQRAALERISGMVRPAQERVSAAIEARGGTVLYRLRGYGAIVARVPRRSWRELQRLPDALSVELESQYRRAQAPDAPAVIAGMLEWAGIGPGTVDLAVVDTGLYAAHPIFTAHAATVLSRIFHSSARLQRDYADDHLDPDDRQGHGTMVAGVLFAPVIGQAPALPGPTRTFDHLYSLKAAYRAHDGASHATQGDVMTAIDASLGFDDPPEVINYSYGSDASEDDDGYCRFFDNVADTFGKTLTLSAGNAGLRAIGTPGIAYNVITVANVNGHGTLGRFDDTIAPTSSAGPTPGGRKKPDIAALGSQVPTASRTGGFQRVTGTSFAAPAIAAAAARLVDMGTVDPRAVKAVMLNSADDFGPAGWDIDFGWGYFNAAATARHAADYVLSSVGPGTHRRRLYARTLHAPAKATLVWNRHIIGQTSRLTDLDLFLYDERDGHLRDASISSIDNVEQVVDDAGLVPVIVVESPVGELTDEPFALAHAGGFSERRGPDVEVTVTATPIAGRRGVFGLRVAVTNAGDLRGHDIAVELQLPRHATASGGAPTYTVGSLNPGETVTRTVTLSAPDSATLDLIRVTATSQNYGARQQVTTSPAR